MSIANSIIQLSIMPDISTSSTDTNGTEFTYKGLLFTMELLS